MAVRMAVVVRSSCRMLAVAGLGLGERCVDSGVRWGCCCVWDVASVSGAGDAWSVRWVVEEGTLKDECGVNADEQEGEDAMAMT